MKYLTILSILATAFISAHGAEAEVRGLQDEDTTDTIDATDPNFYDKVKEFLAATGNTIQSISLPTINIPEFEPIGSGQFLTTITCDEETSAGAPCDLLNGVTGVNVCRNLGGVDVTVCAPKVLGALVGTKDDTCGCCAGKCYALETECKCKCQEGRGVLVNHQLVQILGRQISWKACYAPTIAANVLNARPEFSCWEGCDEESSGGDENEDVDFEYPQTEAPTLD